MLGTILSFILSCAIKAAVAVKFYFLLFEFFDVPETVDLFVLSTSESSESLTFIYLEAFITLKTIARALKESF